LKDKEDFSVMFGEDINENQIVAKIFSNYDKDKQKEFKYEYSNNNLLPNDNPRFIKMIEGQ
jgi:hypothetical protein